jgi:tetratricopeptide (TPR) repeat protein
VKRGLIILAVCLVAFQFNQCKSDTSTAYLQELKNISKVAGDRSKANQLHKKALDEHKKKNYTESERLWYEAAKSDPAWGKTYFNLACTTALQGKKEIAVEYLGIALSLDAKNLMKPAENDSDLKSIRNLESYKELIAKWKQDESQCSIELELCVYSYVGNIVKYGIDIYDFDRPGDEDIPIKLSIDDKLLCESSFSWQGGEAQAWTLDESRIKPIPVEKKTALIAKLKIDSSEFTYRFILDPVELSKERKYSYCIKEKSLK